MTVRLSLALDTGAYVLPSRGDIGVFGPRAGDDLSPLPKDRVEVVQGFFPDHDAFRRQGYQTTPEAAGPYAGAVVFLPRSREAQRAMIAQAARLTEGPVLVDGAKTDGVDAMLRELRQRADVSGVISKSHGKIFAVSGGEFAGWEPGGPREIEGGFVTRPGVFSADGPDPGSVALAAVLPRRLGARVADLGAGWGYLSRAILERDGVRELHLVEADHAALDCARRNVDDPRARFHWADARTFGAEAAVDTVVSNPPFHTGRAADPGLGRAFIEAARRLLAPAGELWLVANRHLPYEKDLRAAFREVSETGSDQSYKIFHAIRPIRRR